MGASTWLHALLARDRRRTGIPPGDKQRAALIPFHVAIIMDGNGRWAEKRHLPILAGHRAGAQAVRRIVEMARDVGLGQLTLYSFSTENWARPTEEVEGLMRLHAEMIAAEVPTLHENDCRVVFVGRREELSGELRGRMEWAESLTQANRRMILFIALNYGGRREIVDAVRHALADGVSSAALAEEHIAAHLYSPLMRDPDLVIRTSGERRLSNFLLWQTAYSELYFTEVLWPDFGRAEFEEALGDFAARDRRFGTRRRKKAAAHVEQDAPGAKADA
ncbi:MAG TPA: polyprenyl diphosphate synthase [Thermoleophilia bacterium]|nr:polyprenyl diphosphate synthase [Thermoleophilia bacterium]